MSSTPTGSPAGADEARRPREVLVGVVARVHGLRGELVVEVRTDSPEERFAPGAVLCVRRRGGPAGEIVIESARPHSGRLLVRFAGVADRDAAEVLRGAELLVDASVLAPPADPDEFHVHQLEGLRAELEDGTVVGTIRDVVHGPGGELLVLARPDAADALVPFVRAIVPAVDLPGGRVVLTPPEGLLDDA